MFKRTPLLLLVVLLGCAEADLAPHALAANLAGPEPRPGVVVDSAIPIPEALRRFQAEISEPPPVAMTGGAASMEDLLRDLVHGYTAHDADELDRLLMTPAEFG